MDTASPSPFSFRPSKRTALALLTGLGAILAGIILFDIYQDWIPEGKPLWSTLAENGVPLFFALAVPLAAWRLARSEQGESYLAEATKWAVLGCGTTLLIAGLALGFQIVQGEIKPLIFVAQLTAAGALVGLLIGYSRVRMRQVQDRAPTPSDRSPIVVSIRQMGGGPRAALAVLVAIGLALMGAILFDVYQDWMLEGKALWSTLVENLIPLSLAGMIPLVGWQLARARRRDLYVTKAATWTLVGAGSTLIVSSIVLGFQLFQGQLKPWIIITQLTTVGGLAGLFIGYNVARVRETRRQLQRRDARLRGLVNSVPGGVFQFEVAPDGTYEIPFISDTTRRLLGVSADTSDAYAHFLDGVPSAYRKKARASLQSAIEEAAAWNVELPFEQPSGERRWIHIRSSPERQEDRLVFHGIVTDITDRKERERQLDAVFNKTFQFTGLMDPDGTLLRANDTALEFGGIEEADVLGRPIWESYWFQGDPSKQKRLREAVAEAANGTFVRYEVEVQGAEGMRMIDFSIRPVTDEHGEVVLLIPEGRDITERKKREQALQDERDRFETLFESLPTPVVRCVVEERGVLVADVNQAFEDTFGLAAPTAEGRDVNELLVPAEHREEAVQLDQRVLEEGHFQTEVRREAADGLRDFQLQVARRDASGGPPEIYAIYADITEQKKRERRLDAIFNQTFQYTGLLTPDGTVLKVNDTALQFGGIEAEDVVGKPLWETPWAQAGPETQERVQAGVQRAAEGEFVRQELEIKGADETRVVDFSIRPVTDADGAVTLLIPEARDITERKEYEEELKAAKEKAEESSRLKSALLANMSHEIRTPLTPINGFAESLAEQLSGPEAKLAQRIRKSGQRLQETIDSVLELSQLEAGTRKLSREVVDLRRAAEEALDVLGAQAQEEGVSLETDLPPTAIEAQGNEQALRRITENLVENAIKFTPGDGQVSVRVDRTDEEALLEVADTGIGIDEEAVPDVFEAFRQESEGFDREFEGTGLGLSIVQRLTDALDGDIEVETEKGEGTCFRIRLPAGDRL
ncbi:MAG: PAS domain S-box protein, partial [Salinibacter sp.]